MYNHILIPVAPGHGAECSESVDAAQRLLAAGGRISVFSVLEELPSYVASYLSEKKIEESANEVTTELKNEIALDGVDVNAVSGHPTNSILTWAEKHQVDCIVMSSHRPGLSDLLLGSTAARVVRHAQCSVVVLR
ncbi:MAG: universal stress protein [Pseudomonadota bacterium]|nr:universal stress protein [Pseudomonadota bacterium]